MWSIDKALELVLHAVGSRAMLNGSCTVLAADSTHWDEISKGHHLKNHRYHRIHVWYIYLHLVDFYGKCSEIYHTWILWIMCQGLNSLHWGWSGPTLNGESLPYNGLVSSTYWDLWQIHGSIYLPNRPSRMPVTTRMTLLFGEIPNLTFICHCYWGVAQISQKNHRGKWSFISREWAGRLKMGVSKNRGLIGSSIINHPFWGTPIFGTTQMNMFILAGG